MIQQFIASKTFHRNSLGQRLDTDSVKHLGQRFHQVPICPYPQKKPIYHYNLFPYLFPFIYWYFPAVANQFKEFYSLTEKD